jgi:hypothetical protein
MDDEDFGIKVTADYNQASQAFDQLLGIIDGATAKASSALASFDAALGRGNSSLLQMAAAISPVGRTVSALVETLNGAVETGRKLAEAFGSTEEFESFEAALGDLKTAASETFSHLGATFGQTVSAAILGDVDGVGNAISTIVGIAERAIRQLQAAIESYRPEQERSVSALETQIRQIEEMLAARRRVLRDGQSGGIAGFLFGNENAQADLRQEIDELEVQLNRLKAILEDKSFTGAAPGFDAAADSILESLREQTQALEIQAATFGMTAGEAARYRAEMELVRRLGRDPGPFAGAGALDTPQAQEYLDRIAQLAQAAADRQAEQRADQAYDRIFTGAGNRVEQLEAQARAIGKNAYETALLTEQERILGQLRAQRIPIDAETEAAALRQAEAFARATEHLRTLQRQMQQVEAIGAVFSRSMERAFSDWLSGTETNWRNLVNTMARDIAMLALRAAILQPLFGGGGTQGGGLFASLISSLVAGATGWHPPMALPGRASGGPVTAGMPYIVGEAGPELYIPGADGTILPNGAGGRTVNMRIDINLAGANGDETIARIARQEAGRATLQAIEVSKEAQPEWDFRRRMLGS